MAMKLSTRKRPDREDKMIKNTMKISEKVFDDKTLAVLQRMISNNIITTLDFPIAQGKESAVYRATKEDDENGREYLAVKIFKYETSSFLHMEKYIEGDDRFGRVPSNRRELVKLWAKKEYANLKMCGEAGISVPEPIAHRDNVVVMELLGENGIPYALLKDVVLENPEKTMNEILENARKAYGKGLVHADLNEYNIVIKKEIPYLIDWGQGVLKTHPRAEEFLLKDVGNIVKYFKKLGVERNLEETIEFVKGNRR